MEWSISWSTSSWRLNRAASGAAILTRLELPRPPWPVQGDSAWRSEVDGDGVPLPAAAGALDKLGDSDEPVGWWCWDVFNWCDSTASDRSKLLANEPWPSSWSSSSKPQMSNCINQPINQPINRTNCRRLRLVFYLIWLVLSVSVYEFHYSTKVVCKWIG